MVGERRIRSRGHVEDPPPSALPLPTISHQYLQTKPRLQLPPLSSSCSLFIPSLLKCEYMRPWQPRRVTRLRRRGGLCRMGVDCLIEMTHSLPVTSRHLYQSRRLTRLTQVHSRPASCLPPSLPSCSLSSSPPLCLPPCLPASLPASLPTYLPTSGRPLLSPFLPSSLPASLPPCLLPSLDTLRLALPWAAPAVVCGRCLPPRPAELPPPSGRRFRS